MKHKSIIIPALIACLLLPTAVGCDSGVTYVSSATTATTQVKLNGDEYKKIAIWDAYKSKKSYSYSNAKITEYLNNESERIKDDESVHLEVAVIFTGDTADSQKLEQFAYYDYKVTYKPNQPNAIAQFSLYWKDVDATMLLQLVQDPDIVEIEINHWPIQGIDDPT